MGSTKPERSISSAIPLPQWMKTKMNDRYDFDEPFSPPSHDDNFFYIRYPKSSAVVQSTNQTSIHEQEQKNYRPISELLEKDPGLSQHTANCRQFIPQVKMSDDLPGISLTKPKKSQGTDDGYFGEAAACGKSVVHVAQQMMVGKHGAESYDVGQRRGSKSLPASPIGTPDSSPAIARRHNPNRYFTAAFGVPAEKPAGGWLLSSLLGQREATTIAEEQLVAEPAEPGKLAVAPSALRRNKSASGIGRMFTEEGEAVKPARPKPSELREMNFWSPTSM